MAVQILAGMADFIRAGAGRAEGIIFFIFMEEKGGIPSVFYGRRFHGLARKGRVFCFLWKRDCCIMNGGDT